VHSSPNHAGAESAFAGDWASLPASPWWLWPLAVRAPPARGVVATGSPATREVIGPAGGTERQAGIMTPTAETADQGPELGGNCGAGDENRTRTISLGSAVVTAAGDADQAFVAVLSVPD
jgi:hypothetical protein